MSVNYFSDLGFRLAEFMLLLTKLLQDLIVKCEDAEQILKDAMSLIPRVENRLNHTPSQSVHSYNGILNWKIDGYQRKREDAINGVKTPLYSKPFYTEEFGYKMCAKIYMNGDGAGKGTHLSLFIVVMKGECNDYVKLNDELNNVKSKTRRLQRRSLRLPTRSKTAQTGHLCTTAQAGADPGIFVCRSQFPGLKVEGGLD